jgi:hypothetical protein
LREINEVIGKEPDSESSGLQITESLSQLWNSRKSMDFCVTSGKLKIIAILMSI